MAFEDGHGVDEVVDVAVVERDRERRAAPPAAHQRRGSERFVKAVDPSQLAQHGHVLVEVLRRDRERPRVVVGGGDAVVGQHAEATRTTTRDGRAARRTIRAARRVPETATVLARSSAGCRIDHILWMVLLRLAVGIEVSDVDVAVH